MPGPTVRLTFAGDSSDLERAMSRVGDSAGRMEKSFSARSAGIAAAGAAAGAGLVSAFTSSLEFEGAAAKLEAQMGAGSQAAGDAGKIAGQLYAQAYGESMGEVSDAVRLVMQSGAVMEDASNEQIQSITGNVMSLASAFDQDLGGATNAVAQMIRTGLAPDAQSALDILTRGFQQGGDKAGDLLDTFNEYSTMFRSLGLDGQAAMGLISQGLQAGARDSDQVADAIGEFYRIATEDSAQAVTAFQTIGLNGEEMVRKIAAGGPGAAEALDQALDGLRSIEDPAQRAQLAVQLFGDRAGEMQGALLALDPSAATQALGDVAGAAQGVNDTLHDTAANKIEEAKRGFQQWSDQIVGMDGPVGDFAAKVAGMGGDAITTAGSLGMAAMALRGLGLWTGIATAAQWLFNAALSMNPIGLVVIGIGLLVGAFIWLWNNVEGFRNFFIGAWDWIKRAAGSAASWISDRFNALVGWFGSLPGRVGAIFSNVGNAIGNAFRGAFNWVADLWNRTIGSLSFRIPDWVPGLGGRSLSMPKLPKFHQGGVVPGAPGAEMLAVLQAGERVIPADRSGGTASGGTVTFRGNTSDALATLIMQMIRTGQIEVTA